MKLAELEPRFLRNRLDGSGISDYVDTPAEATSVSFVCPQCLKDNLGVRPGVHSIVCHTPVVPLDIMPGPGRWTMHGTSVHDLTLIAGSSSIKIEGGAHFFIKDGGIEFCGDSKRCV